MKRLNRNQQTMVLWLMPSVWLVISGCQSTASLERQWLGKSRQSLLSSWGQPSGIEESADGGTVYLYTRTYYPSYHESIGSPVDPYGASASRDSMNYPIQVQAESSTAKFWISPEGTIYRAQGRIIE